MLNRDRVEALYQVHLEELQRSYAGKTIDLTTAAAELGLDPRTVRDMRGFPMIRAGRAYRVRLDSLARWMADREVMRA